MLKLTASLPLLLCAVTPQVVAAAGPAATQGPPSGSPGAAAPSAAAGAAGVHPHAGASPHAAGASPHAAGDAASAHQAHGHQGPPPPPAVLLPTERHLRNLRQLTFGGENAEAYFSFDGKRLSMQSTTATDRCDQIYTLDVGPWLAGTATGTAGALAPLAPLSAGHGRNTCSFFTPDGSRVLFSATRHVGDACPPVPDRSKGYVWPLYNYQIYSARPDGSDVRRLTDTTSYDAEATICRDGSVVFTSDRDGDLELYRMNLDGSGVKRLTFAPGYDGGAFFSEDCKRLVWRAARPRSAAELAEMKGLLKQHLVRPTRMELWTGNADGSDAHPVTELGAASFAPFFIPTTAAAPKGAPRAADRRIIFSSNYGDPRGREFDLWAVNSDGSQLERVTFAPDFDGFPMFSPDGKQLVFASNRGGKQRGETNVFLADWVAVDSPSYTPIPADQAAQRVGWLAAPERQGRGIGSKGLGQAADEIAKWMKQAGLAPAGEQLGKQPRSFFQGIEVFVGVRDQGSRFRLEANGQAARALAPTEAAPAAMSANGKFDGGLRFAGFGITAPESNWDDLAGVDVKGQVALVLRGVPADKLNPKSQRSYSDLRYKAWNLREHGAQAVIFVDPSTDGVPKLTLDGPEGGAGLPVAFLPRALVAKLLPPGGDAAAAAPATASAGPLQPLVRIAEAGKSGSVPAGGRVSGEIQLGRESRRERNVIGLLPATGSAPGAAPRQAPAVVIGAHYDHLGLGGRSSLAPGTAAVHPGADDNASGTAAILTLAQQLAAEKERPFDLYVVAFTAEESGLVGSSRFVQSLPPGLAKERLRAMLNFDMVGRLAGAAGVTVPTVSVQGSDSAEEWAQLIAPACTKSALKCNLGGDGYGPSDMTPFYAAGVPVLFFFTGAHADYHRPSDTADKINSLGIVQVAGLAAHIVRGLSDKLAAQPAGLTLKKPSGPAPRSGDRGYGAYLGTIPDYTAMQGSQGGVKLSGARPQSPAEQAGIKPGDTLIGLGESKVNTLEDMAFALRKYKPGQALDVVVLREGQKLTLRATLAQRQ
jgi:Tol biopolymer transport system component